MARDEERRRRAEQAPIVGGLPEVPGIGVAMRLTPGLGLHLRGLADEVLVNDYPGATLRRDQRETLAAAVSAGNDCFFCMDSHVEHAAAVAELAGVDDIRALLASVEAGSSDGFDVKMQALLHICRTVGRNALALTEQDVDAAREAGATDGDVQLAILIASAFSMYNRLVDGFRARTPADTAMYRPRAREIAETGYTGAVPSTMAAR